MTPDPDTPDPDIPMTPDPDTPMIAAMPLWPPAMPLPTFLVATRRCLHLPPLHAHLSLRYILSGVAVILESIRTCTCIHVLCGLMFVPVFVQEFQVGSSQRDEVTEMADVVGVAYKENQPEKHEAAELVS